MTAVRDGLAAPALRLLAAAQARARAAGGAAIEADRTLVLGASAAPGGPVTPIPAAGPHERVLVLSWIGAHPDARDPLLAALWRLEESARAGTAPVIVLRLAPLVGARSPLVALLARRPRLAARLARALVQPVLEDDVVAGLARLLAGEVEWRGWYELCGPDPMSVGELAEHAAAGAFGAPEADPAWEPEPQVLLAQGLSEPEPWARASGVAPRSVIAGVGARA